MEIAKTLIIAALVTLLFIYLVRPLAHRIGLIDRPMGRKQHQLETPLIGGIAIFFGFCFSLLTLNISLVPYRGLLAGSSILVLMGVIDDFNHISSKVRLAGQFIASLLLVIWSSASLTQAGNLFFSGDMHLGYLSIPISVLVIMTNINAMNMIDGQDGLAGSISLVQTLLLAFVAVQYQQLADLKLLLIVTTLLCVFLAFNSRTPWRRHAAIFLGDAGSTWIAFLLAWFAIRFSQINVDVLKPMAILWIMSFPIFDLLNVVIYRARKKLPILNASRDHIHHILQIAGLSSGLSTGILALFSLGLGIVGLMLNDLGLREAWQFIIWLAVLFGYLLVVQISRSKFSAMNNIV